MTKIHFEAPALTTGTTDAFRLATMAQHLSLVDTISTLIGQSMYEKKIQMLQHQMKTALQVLNNFSHRALLADEVGLGKTIEAGMVIKEYIARKLAKKILILTPAPLAFQWQEEMRSKFSEEFHIPKDPEDYKKYDKIIVSLDTDKTERHADIIREIYWDLLLVDEAHKLKNPQTLNYKFVKTIQKERFLMLTATPLQNNIFELWALLELLHPGFLGTRAQFEEKYVKDEQGLQIKNNDELQEKLSAIMVRNLRKETGIKFVERHVKTLLLDYSPDAKRFYQQCLELIKKRYDDLKSIEKPKEEELTKEELKKQADRYRARGLLTFELIMLTRQITSNLKTGVEALKRYKEKLENESDIIQIENLIRLGSILTEDPKLDAMMKILKKEKDKVIIFTTFLHTQKMIDMELKLSGFSTVIFNGGMNAEQKEQAIRDFKAEKQVLICTDAGAEGRNLQFAHIMINYDLPWNPMQIEQRIGRVHRIGQTKDVRIFNLAVNDTVESYILNRLYEKIDLFQVSVGEMDMILSELKSKNLDKDIFESYIGGNPEELADDMKEAKKQKDKIKEFDHKIFNHGRT